MNIGSASSRDSWIDFLALNGFSLETLYQNIISRVRGHPQKLTKKFLKRAKLVRKVNSKVKAEIEKIPLQTHENQILQILGQTFNLPPSILKSLVRINHWAHQNDKKMLQKLRRNGFKVYFRIINQIHEFVIFSSPKMQQNYEEFGDCVNIDFAFTPMKRAANLRNYYIGVFSGQNSYEKKVIFAICLINSSITQHYEMALNSFFKMFKKHPFSVISTDNTGVKRCLEKLKAKYNFEHYLNWHYKIQKFQNLFYLQKNQSKKGNLLLTILGHTLKEDFLKSYSHLQSLITNKSNLQSLKGIFGDKEKFCLSQMDPSFIGFGIQNGKVSQLLKLLENSYQFCVNLGQFLVQTLEFQKKMIKSQFPSDEKQLKQKLLLHNNLEQDKRLEELSAHVSFSILKKFLYHYKLAKENTLTVKSLLSAEVQAKEKKVKIHYRLANDCWYCQCRQIHFCGLPCSHLIKVIEHFGGCLLWYVNERWLI